MRSFSTCCLLSLLALGDGLIVASRPLRVRRRYDQAHMTAVEGMALDSGDERSKESKDSKRKKVKKLTPIDVQVLQNQLDAVRQLPRLRDKLGTAEDSLMDVGDPKEPTFRRLFTHATWERCVEAGL